MGTPFGTLPNYTPRPETPLTLQLEVIVIDCGLLVRCSTDAWAHVDTQVIHDLKELGGIAAAAFAVRRLRSVNNPTKTEEI